MTRYDTTAAVFFFVSAAAVLWKLLDTYVKVRASRKSPDGVAETLQSLEQRFARVEVALDDLTTELGRLAQGQQFLTKVLADRGADPAALTAHRSSP
jgi:hypothetical protein